jgi:hypothetical protein
MRSSNYYQYSTCEMWSKGKIRRDEEVGKEIKPI